MDNRKTVTKKQSQIILITEYDKGSEGSLRMLVRDRRSDLSYLHCHIPYIKWRWTPKIVHLFRSPLPPSSSKLLIPKPVCAWTPPCSPRLFASTLSHWLKCWEEVECVVLFFFFWWLYVMVCGILVPRAGIEPRPCAALPCLVASVVSDSVTPWTVTHQAPLSMGFSRQECWSGLPCPPPGDLPNPGIEPASLNVSCTGSLVLYHWRWRRKQTELDSILGQAVNIRLHAWSPSQWTLNFVLGVYRSGIPMENQTPRIKEPQDLYLDSPLPKIIC